MVAPSSLPPSIDEDARRRFEAAWRAGAPEPIEHFVSPDHPAYLATLEELVAIELELGWKAIGQGSTIANGPARFPRIEDYLRRFPVLKNPASLARLIRQEYRVRHAHGDRPSSTEYIDRFPDVAASLLSDEAFTPLTGASSPLPHAPDLAFTPELPQVPGYSILAELGSGAMGVVYKACDVQLNRIVALKMIRADHHTSAAALARFRAEAQAVARLKHAGIVEIHHIGEHQGRPYLVLEFCEGGSLAARLARQPLPPRLAADLLARLAEAVQQAHERGIIHRDLKPANVLLDAAGTPKVADFGLARRLEDASTTQTGDRVGTPRYMAPEQAAGQHRLVGPQTDVYALGVILYECLTGRPPFLADTVEGLYDQIRFREPVLPRLLQPGVPRDLEIICRKCLEKEPSLRYASALALAEDLRRFLDGRPIVARPASVLERGWRWARRHPARAALVVVSFALLLGILAGVGLWLRVITGEAARLARACNQCETHLDHARQAARDGNLPAAWEELKQAQALSQEEPRLADLRASVLEVQADLEHHQRAAQDYEALFRGRDDVLFQLNRQLFTRFAQAGNLDEARRLARSAITPFLSASGELTFDATYTASQQQEIRRGCFELLLLEAEAARRQRGPGHDEELYLLDRAGQLVPSASIVHLRRARCLRERGDEEAAEREKAKAAARPATALDALLAGQDALIDNGQAALALEYFNTAVRLRDDLFWAHFFRALACERLGLLLDARASLTVCVGQRHDIVWAYLFRAFVNAELARTPTEQERAPAGGNTGKASLSQAQRDSALRTAEADLAVVARWEQEHPDEGVRYALHVYRSILALRRAEPAKAVAELEHAIRLNSDEAAAYVHLVTAAHEAGQLDLALAKLNEAIQRLPQPAALYRARARAFQLQRNLDAALADLDTAMQLDQQAETPQVTTADVSGDQVERAFLLYSQRRYVESVDACEAALKAAPQLLTPWACKALTLVELGRFREAIEACDRYLDRGRPNARLHRARARARLALHQAERDEAVRQRTLALALSDYDRAVDLAASAQKADLLAERGWVRLSARIQGQAQADFEAALALAPEHASALAGHGHALVQQGKYRDGVTEARKALDHAGPNASWRLLLNIARVHAQAVGKAQADPRASPLKKKEYFDEAIRVLDRCLANVPEEERSQVWKQHFQKADDWEPLRESDRYQDVVRKRLRTSRPD